MRHSRCIPPFILIGIPKSTSLLLAVFIRHLIEVLHVVLPIHHYHVADVHDIPVAPFEDSLWSISDRSEMRAWFDSQFPFFIVVHWHFNILG